ncbi:hypothetical protein [Maribellus mangrovi]|uniref:hypothetical protein n=1 Tax=Maribellus mangrovi TaxID=3133146 RepID=UPI0030ED9F6B
MNTMFSPKDPNYYRLRLSISYQLLKNVYPGNLYFIAKEWLLHKTRNSKLTKSDFDLLYNKGRKEIVKGSERLLINEMHKNGLIVSTLDYELKAKHLFCVQVLIIQNIEHSWVNCRFYSSPEAPRFVKESSPNIVKIIINTGRGGRNGVIPISNKPMSYELNDFNSNSEAILKTHLLPFIFIRCNSDSDKIGMAYGLAKQLFAEASVLLIFSDSFIEMNEVVSLKYPDSNEEIDCTSLSYSKIVKEIRNNYNKQKDLKTFIPLEDLHFVPKRLDLVNSNYSKLVVASLIDSIAEHEKQKLTEALESRYDEESNEFENKINEIIILPVHRDIFKSLSNFEIKEISNYINHFK